MLELIKFFLEKIDVVAIYEVFNKHKKRRLAAQLYLILVQSYEIIEIYRVLLDELGAALETHQRAGKRERFFLNPSRLVYLLNRQASNLEVMEYLTFELMNELRILDNKFFEAYRSLFPGKFSILFEAQSLLSRGRLPLVESQPKYFPANIDGEHRTLWFTDKKPQEDRKQIEKYLYDRDGLGKIVVDVNIHDGDIFFQELARYFEKENPVKRLGEIEILTENYKEVLQQNFSGEDMLTEIGKVRKWDNWAK